MLLGLFVIGYAVRALLSKRTARRFGPRWSPAFGLVGGIFSALFGSGGFIYAIYLTGRIEAQEKIPVTQSALIGLSTLTRVALFLLAGVYSDGALLLLALVLAPAMLGGLYIGRHISLRLSRAAFLRLINILVLGSGVFLLLRYFTIA